MFGKLKRKSLIKTIACFLFIPILLRFLFDDNIFHDDTKYPTDVNLLHHALQRAKVAEIEFDNKYQTTAIILHWKRLLPVQQSVQNFVNSKLFKEIIVWNNNPDIKLAHNQIIPINNSSTLIYIINSNRNLKDQAKYRACASARTLVCFYIDDDWDASHYMKTLIASFRSDPNVLHLATNDMTQYHNLQWTFMDPRIDLHTGFAWIGCGSVFLREHAQRHIQLLNTHSKSNPEILELSDVLFSMWLNEIPSQMLANLRWFSLNTNESDLSLSSADEFGIAMHISSVLAIRKLEYSLRLNDSTTNITFPRKQNRRFPYCVRSPSPNGDFIFFSNVLPVDIKSIPFNITRDAVRATYRNVPTGPNYTHYLSHHTLNAVDGYGETCWRPVGTVGKGDFFAIDFLRIQSSIRFALVLGHSWELQKNLKMRVSFDGVLWISHRSLKGTLMNNNELSTPDFHRLVVESAQFSPELRSFRYIAFNATYAFAEPFQVCDIRIV